MKNTIMFCGKGGVGKTTCAAATALHYAGKGEQTIIISTDFTPSLRHILELDTDGEGGKPARVTDNLYLSEIGEQEVKDLWNAKFGAEVYEVFSAFVDIDYGQFADFVATVLPGIRDEFMVDYIRLLSRSGQYDRIIWDTAPAGQTLGLLRMPSLINRHLKPAPRIYSALKATGQRKGSVLNILRDWEKLSAEDMSFLAREVEFSLVTIPEALAVRQLAAIVQGFRSYQLGLDDLIINQVVTELSSEFLATKAEMQRPYLAEISDAYPDIHRILPMFPYEIKGIARLQEVERALFGDGG